MESAKVPKDAEAQAQNLSGVTGTLLASKLRKVYFTFLSSGSEDQTLFSISGKQTSGRAVSQILGLSLQGSKSGC